jgi:predicted DNA-binding ribbon-helix-helix protein
MAHVSPEPVVRKPDMTSEPTRPVKRSFTLAGHRTSVSLETAFWEALREAAAAEQLTLAALVGRIDAERGAAGLSGAIRVWVLDYYRRAALRTPGTATGSPSPHPSASGRLPGGVAADAAGEDE